MADRFDSARRKVEWAKKRISELSAEVKAFGMTDPYKAEMIGDPWHGVGSYRIAGDPEPLPDSIALIAGDAAHNLRAALDHFACSAVPAPSPSTAFPVWRKPRRPLDQEWYGLVNGKLKDAPPTLVKAVRDLCCWESGADEYVWVVDQFDMTDKHRLLIALAGVTVTRRSPSTSARASGTRCPTAPHTGSRACPCSYR